jgi:hypothetical protein
MKKYLGSLTMCSAAVVLNLLGLNTYAQKVASLEVNLMKPAYGLNLPVSINLDDVTYLSDTLLVLYEIKDKGKTAVPFQIEPGNPRRLTWTVTTGTGQGGKHTYELVEGSPKLSEAIKASVNDGALVIHAGARNLLQYYFKTVYPPTGVDTSYKRSGFIHPLWSPHGQVLTRSQPLIIIIITASGIPGHM